MKKVLFYLDCFDADREKPPYRTQTFKFCSDDCAAVPEDISLDAYSKLLHTSGRSSVS